MDNSNEDGSRRTVRFGPYEADFKTVELRKHGLRIKIQERPLRVLQALVEHAGELVTREELRARIWPSDVYVDFDRNLKTAVNKLRSALCDSAESPRYIETLPRRGFRFIAPVEYVNGNDATAVAPASDLRAEPVAAACERQPEPLPAAHEEPQPADRRAALQPWWRWAAAALVLGLLAGGAAFLRAHHQPAQASLRFHQRDWVLIAQFQNLTRQPVLDRTVQYALTRELSNSRFVSIVSPERVQDALALMKAPANASLTRSLARQVCLRDGGIRALITGRVEKIGDNFVLSAAVVDPSTDTQVAGVEAQTRNLDGILPAVHELSNQLRQTLGETLPEIHASNLKLEKVTTPSLHALQLYSQANEMVSTRRSKEAIPLLGQAVAEDPNFASAHVLLAYAYFNVKEFRRGVPHFEKALQLSGTVSERERLFIEASYYGSVKGDRKREVGLYEALLRLYPNDYWTVNNLAFVLRGLGRWDEAAEMTGRWADLRPSYFPVNFRAWWDLSRMGRFDEAHRYLERARKLETPEIRNAYPFEVVALDSADAESDLRNWNPGGALEETRRLAVTYPAQTGEARNYLADEVGYLYQDLGKLKLAGEWFERLSPDYDSRNLDILELDEARGDEAGERRYLERQFANKEQLGPATAVRLARFGMFAQARYVIVHLRELDGPAEWVPLARGGVALYEGRRSKGIPLLRESVADFRQLSPYAGRRSQAIPLLREAVADFRQYDTSQLTMAADLLATAYQQQGQVAEAIQTLEPLEEKHQLDLQTSFHLFRLYEKTGDAGNAQKIEQNLLRRLAVADPDYPILVKLHRQTKLHAGLFTKP